LNSAPVFETLQAYHDRQGFDCGNPVLNDFLQRQARQNADRNVGVTHVAVEVAGDSKILAYYTLVTRTLDAAIVPGKKLPRGEIGVVLLGRLAVDITAQRGGLGRLCVTRAIVQVEQAARDIGIHALVLDAIDDKARDWYLALDFGFQQLLDDPRHLYLPIGTIRAAFPNG
jgi:GNAT superfamily N-acetyltransferase